MARICLVTLLASLLLQTIENVPVAAAGDARLADAAQRQDHAAARALIKQRKDVNAPQPGGATALHWAAHWDDSELAELLIAAGARVDAANEYGVTPLVLAAANGSAPMVERLVAAGANANYAQPTGETVLMTASRAGNAQAVKALLAAGAAVDIREPVSSQTALMWAAAEGHTDTVKLLLERGAEVNARSKTRFSPLLFAVRGGSLEIVRLLVDAGASVNDTAADGTAALLLATVFGHVPVAEFLLDRGADPNADASGFTALHWAAGRWDTSLTFTEEAKSSEWYPLLGLNGTTKHNFMKKLLAHGADPSARTTKNPVRHGLSASIDTTHLYEAFIDATPFLFAAYASDPIAMRMIAAAGGDTRRPTANGMTPLMIASGLGWVIGEIVVSDERVANAYEAVKIALETGGEVNAKSAAGDTALMGAAHSAMDKVIQLLADQGADLNARNLDDDTALMMTDGRGAHRAGHKGTSKSTNELLKKLGATEDGRYSQTKIRYTDLLNERETAGRSTGVTDAELADAKKKDERVQGAAK